MINIRDRINVPIVTEKQSVSFYVIDLTPFEYGNAIWKLFIRNRITKDEAELSLKLFENLVDLGIITILEFKEYIEAIRISTELKVSYYDAAYITTARKRGLTLATDDDGLLVN